jgi:tricarballylate dehydrogenase
MNKWDVIVVGSGNAGACAAISAQEHGANVIILEKTRKESRGGNTSFSSGIFGFPNEGIEDVRRNLIPDLSEEEAMKIAIPPYTKDDLYRDIMKVTQGRADPELLELHVNNARPTIEWMTELGIKWELYEPFSRYNGIMYYGPGSPVRAKGGGPGLIDMEFEVIESKGINIMYEAMVTKLLVDDEGKVVGVKVKDAEGRFKDIMGKTVVLCAGSFNANPEMRAKYLGKNWDIAKVRGSRYNTGEVLMAALEVGAQPGGHWSGCHCAQIHADSPDVEADSWEKRRSLYSWMWGILVNKDGKRFVDEGEDWEEYVYAKLGRIIFETQPDSIAYQIYDSKPFRGGDSLILSSYYQPWISFVEANSLEELAEKLGMDPNILKSTVEEYNRAVDEDVKFNPGKLDGKSARGITPQKSNWARKIDTAPFKAFPVTGGIGFTFAGLKINTRCEVLDLRGKPIKGLYTAGELAGGLFYFTNFGGSGLTKGAVTGRIAGANAAEYAKSTVKN